VRRARSVTDATCTILILGRVCYIQIQHNRRTRAPSLHPCVVQVRGNVLVHGQKLARDGLLQKRTHLLSGIVAPLGRRGQRSGGSFFRLIDFTKILMTNQAEILSIVVRPRAVGRVGAQIQIVQHREHCLILPMIRSGAACWSDTLLDPCAALPSRQRVPSSAKASHQCWQHVSFVGLRGPADIQWKMLSPARCIRSVEPHDCPVAIRFGQQLIALLTLDMQVAQSAWMSPFLNVSW
jgi:hypothetical protein